MSAVAAYHSITPGTALGAARHAATLVPALGLQRTRRLAPHTAAGFWMCPAPRRHPRPSPALMEEATGAIQQQQGLTARPCLKLCCSVLQGQLCGQLMRSVPARGLVMQPWQPRQSASSGNTSKQQAAEDVVCVNAAQHCPNMIRQHLLVSSPSHHGFGSVQPAHIPATLSVRPRSRPPLTLTQAW